jgi:hypothetical protein
MRARLGVLPVAQGKVKTVVVVIRRQLRIKANPEISRRYKNFMSKGVRGAGQNQRYSMQGKSAIQHAGQISDTACRAITDTDA